MELLTSFNRRGITILMVTHEREMVAFAHTIGQFKDGVVDHIETRPQAA